MANILDIQTVGGVQIASVDVDPSLGLGTDLPVGSFALATDGSGSFYKRSNSLTDWVNTSNNALDGWQQDDLVTNTPNTPGESIIFATSVASGGSVTSSPTNLNAFDVNGLVAKSRYGLETLSITAAASARANMQNPTNTRFQVQSSTVIGFGADLAFNGGQINFANDPSYQYAGFVNTGATAPTQGVYIRPPYVGETSFYKYCLTYFDSGTSLPVRLTFDSPVVYDSANNKFLSMFIIIDSPNDSVTYTLKENGNTHTFTINNVVATYPDMWSGSIINMMNIGLARIGTPVTGVAQSIVVDKVYRYIKPNYNY